MRALILDDWGADPRVAEAPTPVATAGRTLVRVGAASLNPADLAIASGRFYLPLPAPPFVPGAEAVGEVVASAAHPAGRRVWCLTMTGALGEVVAVDDAAVVPVPDGTDDAAAAALGIAGLAGWMPVLERGGLRAGETLVVLGASGVVGQVAIQAGRVGGAGRIVAVCRSAEGRARALSLGADEALPLGDDLVDALRSATRGDADVVVDTLWGDSAGAAISCLSPGGRLVQVGNAESPQATLVAGPFRGGRLDLRGFSVFSEPAQELARCYPALSAAAARGDVTIAVDVVAFDDAPAAWARQAAGAAGAKLVVRIDTGG